MKKKILSLALVVVMVALVAAGSMAYFTATDNAANVITLGNVSIDLVERQYVDGAWSEIDEDTDIGPLQPGVINYYNKCIYTINDGKDDAYIRNFVAVECSPADENGNDPLGYYFWYNDQTNTYSDGRVRHGVTKVSGEDTDGPTYKKVKINDRLFDIYVFDTLNKEAVAAGSEVLSMSTIYLTTAFTSADAEYFQSLEVYTVSEAIQAAGFADYDAAMAELGEATETHAAGLFANIIPTDNQ